MFAGSFRNCSSASRQPAYGPVPAPRDSSARCLLSGPGRLKAVCPLTARITPSRARNLRPIAYPHRDRSLQLSRRPKSRACVDGASDRVRCCRRCGHRRDRRGRAPSRSSLIDSARPHWPMWMQARESRGRSGGLDNLCDSRHRSWYSGRLAGLVAAKDVATAGVCPHFGKQRHHLRSKGHDVLALHLHAAGGHPSERLCTGEFLKLVPCRKTGLVGARPGQQREEQCGTGNGASAWRFLAVIPVDRPHARRALPAPYDASAALA